MQTKQLITQHELVPHPEGGWYRELYRSPQQVKTASGQRAAVTQIYYLLEAEQISRWHVIDADEIWHFYAGCTLELFSYDPQAEQLHCYELGNPLDGYPSTATIPAGHWQAARPKGGFAFMGCTVAPGFEFATFHFVSDLSTHAPHFDGALKTLQSLR